MGWEVVFWCSVFFVSYAFVGYPITIGLLARMFPTPVTQGDCTSKVVLVICAYNEESSIREKIENSLALDYPKEQLDILVVSDCSSDKTDQIVSEYQALGVRLLRLPERRGKTAAQNLAVANAKGEIVIFSDASILLEEKSIRNLVRNFADPTVGCVSCEDKAVSMRDGKVVEDEGLYVRYEMAVRRWESRFGSIVGASGCFYGLRRALWRQPDDFLVVDFTTALDIREQGYRTVSEPQAVAYVKTVVSPDKEFARRVRTATRGLVGLWHKRLLLNPLAFGTFSFQVFGHKLLRFLAPFFLILILTSNTMLAEASYGYAGLLLVQVIFYGSAFAGYAFRGRNELPRVLSFPMYFVMVNWAILVAWARVFQGKTDTMWTPTQRALAK